MSLHRTSALYLITVLACATAKDLSERPQSRLTPNQQVVHLLNRITYGPRPGDVERVSEAGIEALIEEQLHPAEIDDSSVETRLAELETLHLSTRELWQLFPRPNVVRDLLEAGSIDERDIPPGYKNAIFGKSAGKRFPNSGENLVYRSITRFETAVPVSGSRNKNHPPILGVNSQQLVIAQMQAAKLIRAVDSDRQLEEIMVDFWLNHFNVFARKGPIALMMPSYERDVIRPHALGRFRDLLGATAKSPAMLFYLDNARSFGPNSVVGRRRQIGLNENYARELMELHTLGVNGGYTQQDVTEVAKVFTGWTAIARRSSGGPHFRFVASAHELGTKMILGQTIRQSGIREGERLLDLLANHPSTGHSLATKLARRFVSDDPPESLVNRVAKAYANTDGDIREMLRTILYSDEFWSAEAFQAKTKKPLELVASTVRAVDGQIEPTPHLLGLMQRLGESLYLCQPPTGYPDTAADWLNSGTLVYRWNFALAAGSGRIPGLIVRPRQDLLENGLESTIESLQELILHGEMVSTTKEGLEDQARKHFGLRADRPLREPQVRYLAGLVLGSPDFQRR